MKNRRQRAKQVKQKRVAALASYSRRHSVNNCTIPNITNGGTGKWKIPECRYPQSKTLRKKYKKKYWCKDGFTIRKIVNHPSDWDNFKTSTLKHKSIKNYQELLVDYKVAKWVKKHPCPVKSDSNQQDLFEQEFVAPWKQEYEKAVEHIRKVVFSKNDKLSLVGRFEEKNSTFTEEKVAEITDRENEGDNINKLNPKKSPLLRKAQKKTNQIKAKRNNLVCTNLRDRKNKRGRIILPKAA